MGASIMPRLRLFLSSLFVATAGFAASGALAQPRIEWEIANRFRLFKKEEQFRKLTQVFAALPEQDRKERPSFAFEDAMQRAAAARTLGSAFGDPASVARWGWTSAVTRETCFQSGNRGHFPCRLDTGDEYLEPKSANLIARLPDPPAAFAGKICDWSAAGRTASARCDKPAKLPGIPFGRPFDIAVKVDGTLLAELKAQTIRHITIVGFGDSFSSGEGNPDKPVDLVDASPATYSESSPLPGLFRSRSYPLRHDGGSHSLGPRSAAIWLNEQCHRSLYSQHVRAALILALSHRDLAVSLMAYSCTGAEVTAGILGYDAARDDVASRFRDASPQLMRYLRDFCTSSADYRRFDLGGRKFDWRTDLPRCTRPRELKPDVVLLSIGGNDVGFSNVIAHEIVGNETYGLRMGLVYRLWLKAIERKSFAAAREAVRTVIPQRTRELSDAFERHLALPASMIVQTAYPQLTRTGEATTCEMGESGMDVHRIMAISKADTGEEGARFVPFLNEHIERAIGGLPADRRWRFVDSHVERFAGHALCSPGAPADTPGRHISGAMRFPTFLGFKNNRFLWEPFAPSEWRAYRPRNRWFVTPNDAFLTGHYMRVAPVGGWGTPNPQDKEQPLLAATLGGSFHPNASGHATIADATIPVLREVLGLPQP